VGAGCERRQSQRPSRTCRADGQLCHQTRDQVALPALFAANSTAATKASTPSTSIPTTAATGTAINSVARTGSAADTRFGHACRPAGVNGHSVFAILAVSWPTAAAARPARVHHHTTTPSTRSAGSSPCKSRVVGSPPWTAQTGQSISCTSSTVPETRCGRGEEQAGIVHRAGHPPCPVQYEPSGTALTQRHGKWPVQHNAGFPRKHDGTCESA
jgi:hypothetical protein